jgi:DNA-binding beta-propeller fold protein YncE
MNATRTLLSIVALGAALAPAACGSPSTPPGTPECAAKTTLGPNALTGDMKNRAYVASRDSGNVTVIDLERMEVAASVDTCSSGYHMVEFSQDFSKAYASSPDKSKLDVIDARSLAVEKQIAVGKEPTHLSLSKDGKLLANVLEGDNAVAFIDTATSEVVARVPGFYTPHFVRFAPDGRYAYVANLGAYHITRIDLSTLSIDGHIALDGYDSPPNVTETTEQVGFADVQIDSNGILWAAHGESNRVLVYDTKTQTKLPEQDAGHRPWIVYAEHPFTNVTARVVPNHVDRDVKLLDLTPNLASTVITGEPESYGVNYTPYAVGGNTETASTTADGRYIVAAVSSANRVVVIDARTNEIRKTFDHIGNYPWTVTIPLGQNYCH